MRFAFIILSIFAIALSSNLDPYSETEKFLLSYWDHLKAKNYTIIDPEFVGFVDNVTYNKEELIKKIGNPGKMPDDEIPKLNVTNAIFDAKGILKFNIKNYGHISKFTAKPNANIKGGYALFKLETRRRIQ
ncbi:unnamed protein product [Caenorhabditis angaria]|uniref:Uncharacterized protein n=1 Tax=Caenorhabditis angaria TaxID=860376 RepID=A0A9P1J1T8_9PELO|nr:unnamed protein product [Caenorhabditis angaria]